MAHASAAELSAAAPALDFARPVRAGNEAAALRSLLATLEALLAGCPSSDAADRAALAGAPPEGVPCGAEGGAGDAACAREARATALREKTLLLAARDATLRALRAVRAARAASAGAAAAPSGEAYQLVGDAGDAGDADDADDADADPLPVLRWERGAGGAAGRARAQARGAEL